MYEAVARASESLATGTITTSGAGGAWQTAVSPIVETMPAAAIEAGRQLLGDFSRVFPGGNTWVAKTHGVPSLFVRLDCAVCPDGTLGIYEVEERPCGFGITLSCNPQFADRLSRLRRKWPHLQWVRSEHRATDDALWLGEGLSLAEARDYDGHLLVRSRPEEHDFHCLEDRAVSSVSCEGNKDYGVKLGLWDIVSATHDGDLDWYLTPALDGPCILKPMVGTRSRHVKAYIPSQHREELRSRIVLRSSDIDGVPQLVRLVRNQPNKAMYRQRLIEPMRFPHQPERNAIYRLFYGYDPDTGTWEPLGGVWMALDSIIVHGTDRTVTGALVCPE